MTRPTGTTRRARRVGAGLLAAAALVLTACGSDDDGGNAAADTSSSAPSSSSPSETASGAPGAGATDTVHTLEVTSVDFDYELPSTDLAAGEYTIELTNDGSATHDLVVERDGEDVAGTEDIGPGQSSAVTVTLEPGEYVFYCSIGNHRGMGMEVTVTVT
ncbi:plastocyanin/azurin family copper-binding protein [Blastococcus sp. TF02A-26]|uniref:cupredoxin domain-containing protein n=1 Tax=Blastococcus sp. TF02A-26 TaxID=2250577 RepID=UPI001314A110|nr:plastocyanin/azurin family copper-binding protein [Blastococcus sp. TF02A-26]